jgi:hypothetical protein
LVGADVELGKACHKILFGWMSRTELEDEVQLFKELERVALLFGAEGLHEIDLRGGRRSRLADELGERLHLIPGLNFLHIFDVIRREKLGPVKDKSEFCFAWDHTLDAVRLLAFPGRSRDHVVARVIAGCTRADIAGDKGMRSLTSTE